MAKRERETNYTILYRKLKIEQQKNQSELSRSVRVGSSCTTGVLLLLYYCGQNVRWCETLCYCFIWGAMLDFGELALCLISRIYVSCLLAFNRSVLPYIHCSLWQSVLLTELLQNIENKVPYRIKIKVTCSSNCPQMNEWWIVVLGKNMLLFNEMAMM
jgi:hypothetical protein